MMICGTTIDDKYEIVGTIGTGGFGTVYKAWQKQFDRMVAIKLLNTGVLEESDGLMRFEREAKAIAGVQHKNIISFYGYGVWQQSPYMVMDFIEGTNLHAMMRAEGKLEPLKLARIMKQVCEGLACAHAHGIVHRDLKPTNIMLEPGPDGRDVVKIIDFGLVKLMPGYGVNSQKLTEAGCALGTCNYMSPEQCVGGDTDHRVDLYAVGCILHEAVTGSLPFDGDEAVAVMYQHINDAARPICDYVQPSPVVDALQAVIAKAMAKSSEERYQSANDIVADLDSIIRGESGKLAQAGRSSQRTFIAPQTARSARRKLPLFIAITAALMTACAVGLYYAQERPPVELTVAPDSTSLGLYDDVSRRVRNDDDAVTMIPALEETIAQNEKDKRLDPDRLSELYRRLSYGRWKLGHYQSAFDAIEKAIQIRDPKVRGDKNGWRYYNERANALWGLKKYDEALQVVQEMLNEREKRGYAEVAEDYAALTLNRIYISKAEYARAENALTKALQRDGTGGQRDEMTEELAADKVYLGQFAGAHDLYTQLLGEKKGRGRRALLGLIRCALHQRHYEEARKYLHDLWKHCTKQEKRQYDIMLLRIAITCGLNDRERVDRMTTELCAHKDVGPQRDLMGRIDQNVCFDIMRETGYADLQQKIADQFGKI